MSSNSDQMKQIFIDCAYYGYLGGLQAVLEADNHFDHDTWAEALRNSAIADNAEVAYFLLHQFILQREEIVLDSEWLRMLEVQSPRIAKEIDLADRYVRASKMREKLEGIGIRAPEVKTPPFFDPNTPVYLFAGRQRAPAPKKAVPVEEIIHASAGQFGGDVPPVLDKAVMKDEADIIADFLSNNRRGGI